MYADEFIAAGFQMKSEQKQDVVETKRTGRDIKDIKDRTIWCGGQESSASMRGVMWRISYPDVVFCVEMDDIRVTFQNYDFNTIFRDIIMGTAISFFYIL